jgi:hypothetical protein
LYWLLDLRLHRRRFVGLDEAISSFRDCGVSYGLCDQVEGTSHMQPGNVKFAT